MNRIPKLHRQGAVVVEFAITAPLLFLILFGCLELSHANMVFNVAEAAAFEGAREAIIPGATAAEAEAAAQRILNISRIRNAQVTVNPANLAVDTETVQVTVRVVYSQNSILPPNFTRNLVMVRDCTLVREGDR